MFAKTVIHNVTRTVREYQKRGVAGLHLEGQGFPKKCGHLDDNVVIPRDDYLAEDSSTPLIPDEGMSPRAAT